MTIWAAYVYRNGAWEKQATFSTEDAAFSWRNKARSMGFKTRLRRFATV